MHLLNLVLLIVGAVCFALAAFWAAPHPRRDSLVPLGLFAWILIPLIAELTKR